MSFIQYPDTTPVFPVLSPLTWSVFKKPIMASRVTVAISGRETKLACCAYPRWEFTLSYGGGNSWLRDQTQNVIPDPTLAGFTELTQLLGLFVQCQGSYGEFYYVDPDDVSRAGALVAVADGSSTTYQLFVPYGNGPLPTNFVMPAAGIASLDQVYVGNTPTSATLNVTNIGCFITFGSPPAGGSIITADFQFYYRCRFKDDTLQYTQIAQNLWDVKEVRFESVKP